MGESGTPCYQSSCRDYKSYKSNKNTATKSYGFRTGTGGDALAGFHTGTIPVRYQLRNANSFQPNHVANSNHLPPLLPPPRRTAHSCTLSSSVLFLFEAMMSATPPLCPRNQSLFAGALPWHRASDEKQYFSALEVNGVLRDLCIEQGYSDSNVSGIQLSKKSWQNVLTAKHRTHRCYFHTTPRGGCKFAIRETYRSAENDYFFLVGNCAHSVHICNPSVKGKMMLTSPSALRKTPGEFIRNFAANCPDANCTEQQKAVEGFKRTKYSIERNGLPPGVSMNSRAAVLATLNQYLYSVVSKSADFDGDTVYLCEDRQQNSFVLEDGEDNSPANLVAVFSTEELLLNLYRQICTGQDYHIQMDASYRYTTEKKMGYIPVKVSSLTQTGRSVAYAIVTKEDSNAHEFIVKSINTAVEAVVNRRIQKGDRFV